MGGLGSRAGAAFAALLGGVLALAGSAHATECTPPPAATIPERVLPRLESFTLANGLRVHIAPRPGEDSVSVRVAYDVGARDEAPGRGGVAHLFEHMMFKGSAGVPDGGHFRLVRDVGGRTNATTDYDTTQYWNTVPREALERVLFAEADRMRSLRIDDVGLDNQRAAIREEGLGLENLPYVTAATHFALDLWSGTPYGHSPLGTPEELAAMTAAEARAFHARWYAPTNAVLVVAGGVEPGAARAAIERHFGAIPNGPPRPEREAWTLDRSPRQTVASDPLAPFPVHAFVWQTVGATDERAIAIAVLDDLLMGHPDARLVREVATPLALDAYAVSLAFRDVGLLNYVFVPRTFARFGAIRDALAAQVEDLRARGPAPRELCHSLRRVHAQRLARLATNEGLAAALAVGELWFGDARAAERELAALSALRPSDLRDAARQWLADDANTLQIRPSGALRWLKPLLELLPDAVGRALERMLLS